MKTKVTVINCPKCGCLISVYDTPGLTYICMCDECGWESPLDYYLNPDTEEMELMNRSEAFMIGGVYHCPDCKDDMETWEHDKYGRCIMCQTDKNLPL